MAYAFPSVAIFVLCALMTLGGALGVLLVRNPVHAALSLIMSLFGVALGFLAQAADFLAAVEIIVYAGAIVVLFLFVIMFLGIDRRTHAETEPLVGQRFLAAIGVGIVIAGIIVLIASSHWVTGVPSVSTNGTPLATGSGNIAQIGGDVFTTYLVAFEATGALLLISVIGAVNLARKERPRVGEGGA